MEKYLYVFAGFRGVLKPSTFPLINDTEAGHDCCVSVPLSLTNDAQVVVLHFLCLVSVDHLKEVDLCVDTM